MPDVPAAITYAHDIHSSFPKESAPAVWPGHFLFFSPQAQEGRAKAAAAGAARAQVGFRISLRGLHKGVCAKRCKIGHMRALLCMAKTL